MENRSFRGIWIPSVIWLNKDLSLTEKCFLAEIESLGGRNDGCFASNQHFGDFFGIASKTVSNTLCVLIKKGFLVAQNVENNGRRLFNRFPKSGQDTSRKTGTHFPKNGNPLPEIREQDAPPHMYGRKQGENRESTASGSSFSLTLEEGENRNENHQTQKKKTKALQTEAEWLAELQASEAYRGIDIPKLYQRMIEWCKVNGKQATRRRFVNWLNKTDIPLNGNGIQKPKEKPQPRPQPDLPKQRVIMPKEFWDAARAACGYSPGASEPVTEEDLKALAMA